MFGRLIRMFFFIIITITLLALAMANRKPVTLVLDPFNHDNPTLSLSGLPFFLFLFAMLALGVFLGGIASWLSQGKWRKMARQRTQEAMRLKAEVERLTKQRDEQTDNRKQLIAN